MHFIQTEQISYRYPNGESDEKATFSCALKDVSIHMDEGQYVCILGRNGSGKSTLAKHLNALLTPDQGMVTIDGMDSRDAEKLWDIRRMAGMVFQNPDNQMVASTVEEEVAFGPENLGMSGEDIVRAVESSLEQVGLSGENKTSPQFLSGGRKQRIAIAGVLAMQPKCIILDEATAMLDPVSRKEVMDAVRDLVRVQHITVINITHFMEEALDAVRIYVMDGGQIVMKGTPGEIFSREEELHTAGLRLPPVCQIAQDLRRQGLDIPAGILTEEDLVNALEILRTEKQKKGSDRL